MKKTIAILLVLMLSVTLIPAVAWAAPTYDIHICPTGNATWVGIQSSVANDDVLGDGTVKFTPAQNGEPATLTLTGANLKYIQSTLRSDLRVVLVGENQFYTSAVDQNFTLESFGYLEICGSGSATMKNDFVDSDGYGYPCIQTEGNLTIKGATITAESKAGTNPIYAIGTLSILEGANVTSTAVDYPGLWSAGNMTIDDSTVKVTTGGNGIWCDSQLTISGSADVTVTAGANYVGIGTGGGMKLSEQAKVTVKDSMYGLLNDGSAAIEICDDAQVDLTVGWGVYNIGGKLIVSGGTTTIHASGYAIVNKPDLSSYMDPCVLAGSSADDAAEVEDIDVTNYHNTNKYVKIMPRKAETPAASTPLIPQVNVPNHRLPEYIEAEEVIEDVPDVEEGTADIELNERQ